MILRKPRPDIIFSFLAKQGRCYYLSVALLSTIAPVEKTGGCRCYQVYRAGTSGVFKRPGAGKTPEARGAGAPINTVLFKKFWPSAYFFCL